MEKINVVNMIYEQMSLNNPPRERKLRHYPSGVPYYDQNGTPQGKCKRQLFYQMSGIEETHPIDPVALFKMDVGNIIHDKMDEVLNQALARIYGENFNATDEKLMAYVDKLNVDIKMENAEIENLNIDHKDDPDFEPVPMRDLIDPNGGEIPIVWNVEGLKFPFSGRMDKIININGKRGFCEWKSTYGFGARMIQNEGPKLEALLQSRSYLENLELDLDFIIIVYIARDSGYMFGYYIEMGENKDDMTLFHMNSNMVETRHIIWDGITKACKEVEDAVESETLPDRDYHVNVNPKTNTLVQKGGSWQCRYCSYRGICYGVAN